MTFNELVDNAISKVAFELKMDFSQIEKELKKHKDYDLYNTLEGMEAILEDIKKKITKRIKAKKQRQTT